tara:strand:- start:356 stop:538 length:183 start_codon:yes stop_codon:yes gene_type:complete
MKTKEILKYLKISRGTLDKNKDLLSRGVHYIQINPKNPRSPYRWHYSKVEKAFMAYKKHW